MGILEQKNVASRLRNLLDWPKGRLWLAEDMTSDEKSKGNIQTYAHRGNLINANELKITHVSVSEETSIFIHCWWKVQLPVGQFVNMHQNSLLEIDFKGNNWEFRQS